MFSARFLTLTGVTGVHLAALALIAAAPGEVAPPAMPVVQGILVPPSVARVAELPKAKQSLPAQPLKQQQPAPAPRPAPVVAPQPPPLPTPKAPPSERTITATTSAPSPAKMAEVNPTVAAHAVASDNAGQAQPKAVAAAAKSTAGAGGASDGPVTMPRVDAGHLNNPAPVYPAVSRRFREQGQVLLDVLILPDGMVGQIRLKTSSGYPRLDNAALDAVKRWRYLPARRGSTPIAFWYVQPMVFSLQN